MLQTQQVTRSELILLRTPGKFCLFISYYAKLIVNSADVPLPPSDADSEWEKYAAAFGASEIDRMLVEEQVKVERKLRMVLDEETQDIITLGEFEARIKHRSRGLKRQLDGGEDVEWAEKRVKY